MNKTIRIIREGEKVDDYAWALAYTESERLKMADELTRRAWQVSRQEAFPSLDRSRIRVIRQRSTLPQSCNP